MKEELWPFILDFYGRPGVAETCLRLQDQKGVEIDLLLFGIWLGLSGRGRLDAEVLERLREQTGSWRAEVVMPLRKLRRFLKGRGAEDFREELRRLELEAERRYLNLLLESLGDWQGEQGEEDAVANLILMGGEELAEGVRGYAPSICTACT